MTSPQWEQVKDWFEAILDQDDPQRRQELLAKLQKDSPSLAQEVERLVSSYHAAGSFLNEPCKLPVNAPAASVADQGVAPGDVLGERFRILRLIAKGGMGEVYEAEDQILRERIALKTVLAEIAQDADSLERLRRELQLARRISHPNVCRVHEFFESSLRGRSITFYTMEFLEGETLREWLRKRGRMGIQQALPVVSQIAEGLAASHGAGVIHRDLKPSNIVLVETGSHGLGLRAVLTDYGIAQRSKDAAGLLEFAAQTLTPRGGIVGSLSYMAPEQIEKAEATALSDIYSLGLITYEMITGRAPFSERGLAASLAERLKGPAISLGGTPNGIEAQTETLIRACLAVVPADRIQSATLIAKSIHSLVEPAGGPIEIQAKHAMPVQTSIAVLPFVLVGSDPQDEFFGDGLTEELMAALANVQGLRVVARTSTFSYRNKNLDIREIGRQLGVDLLIEGTVRRSQTRLRITVRLVSASGGHELWSKRYDKEVTDIFAVQDEIASAVAQHLSANIDPETGYHFVPHRTDNPEAHVLFLKGRFFWNKRTKIGLEKATEYFTLATASDPNFAPALAALAECYVTEGVYGTKAPQEVFPLAKDAISKASQLGPTIAGLHCAAGCLQAMFDWDWSGAERSFLRAIELDSTYPTAHHWYAINCLAAQGRFAEARAHVKTARDNDPLSLPINTTVGLELYFERKYEDAIREYRKVLEIEPNFGIAHFFLGQAFEQTADFPAAISAFERSVTLTERSPESLAMLARAYAVAGHLDSAKALLGELTQLSLGEYVSPVLFAQIWLALNDKSSALKALYDGLELRAADITWLGVRPVFDPLREDASFRTICDKVGLKNVASRS